MQVIRKLKSTTVNKGHVLNLIFCSFELSPFRFVVTNQINQEKNTNSQR
jgi:hypothetical protein